TFLWQAKSWHNSIMLRSPQSPTRGRNSKYCLQSRTMRKTALWLVLEFRYPRRRNAEYRIRRFQLGEVHAACTAEAVAQFPAQGQKEEQICEGSVHPDSGAKLVRRIKARTTEHNAQPHDLV